MKKPDRIAKIVIAIVAAVCIILGVYTSIRANKFRREGVEIDALITDIVVNYSGDETDYDVYVSFTVDGKEYSGMLDVYHAGMNEGDYVPIRYLADNPNEFAYAKMTNVVPIICFSVGIVCAFITVFPLVIKIGDIKDKFKKKNCNEVIATINDVESPVKLSATGKKFVMLTCSNGTAIYETKFFTDANAQFVISDKISVFVKINNSEKYFVDYKKYLKDKAETTDSQKFI